MSDLDENLHLFKAPWVADPKLLADSISMAKVSDRYTAELAAWCAEIHEHLRELSDQLGIELMLMGGNGASLRFDAVEQRGSRDNDYLTAAEKGAVERLMERFGERFGALGELMQPAVYKPKNPVRDLPMTTYVVPVPLRLNHGKARNNEVKVEFHFEERLPPKQTLTGALGPAATPTMTAALPELPYQVGFKLMTLARDPVGIDETTRAAAVPRQMYDLDLLLAGLAQPQWHALVDYCRARYAEECAQWDVSVADGEPFDGIRKRLTKWGDCLDENADPWKTIRTVQQTGLQRPVHLKPWGWRARAHRLIAVSECLRLGAPGWDVLARARDITGRVPLEKARPWRNAVAELAGVAPADLPVELRHYLWPTLTVGTADELAEQVARADGLVPAAP